MSACEKWTREMASKLGATIELKEGKIHFHMNVKTLGRYGTYRDTWEEVASALAVLGDVDAYLGESDDEPDDFDPAFRDWANAEYDSDSGSDID